MFNFIAALRIGESGALRIDRADTRFPRNRRVQSSRKRVESGCWTFPAQLVRVIEERDVGSERGEPSKKQRVVPLAGKSICERKRVGDVHSPLAVVHRDGFEMEKLGKDGS